MQAETREKKASLLSLLAPFLIWSVHFLACYFTAAIWCAKVGGTSGSLAPVRWAIAAYTVLALAGIGLGAKLAYGRYRAASNDPSAYRFLDQTTLLLAGLSALAIVYSALAAVFIETCR